MAQVPTDLPTCHPSTRTQAFYDSRDGHCRNVKALMNYHNARRWKNLYGSNEPKPRRIKVKVHTPAMERTETQVPKWEKLGYESYQDYIRCRVHRGQYKS